MLSIMIAACVLLATTDAGKNSLLSIKYTLTGPSAVITVPVGIHLAGSLKGELRTPSGRLSNFPQSSP